MKKKSLVTAPVRLSQNGQTALQLARSKGHTDLADAIEAFEADSARREKKKTVRPLWRAHRAPLSIGLVLSYYSRAPGPWVGLQDAPAKKKVEVGTLSRHHPKS